MLVFPKNKPVSDVAYDKHVLVHVKIHYFIHIYTACATAFNNPKHLTE